MNRNDVCRLEFDYTGELATLASQLGMIEPVYDQEADEDGLHEYVYGDVAGERVEAIRQVGAVHTAVFRFGSLYFSVDCLQHVLRSLRSGNVRVNTYWTRDSLQAGVAMPYEVGNF
ncbi:hypothetical protein LXT12_22215 [Pelomonas sp. P7]|uniref:Uncharacterized protein n=1 Tax=Pelomonas caseinilytica TaxID=2906763 RepID=A0ABS8XRX7_9BURK|nr:hypothetical protein [Pelomonas sp. P7]MCE4539970.1 hypothetical protein [Pelomonas sp. P7]